jgi:hypothetical protein
MQTLPHQFGIVYNAHMLETIAQESATAIRWRASGRHAR